MPKLHVYADKSVLISAVADYILEIGQQAIEARGVFTIALSGGSTPRPLYELLATPDMLRRLAWKKVQIFWGDERTVPPSHADSNYLMARHALLDHLRIQPDQIHRIKGELDPYSAADDYIAQLKAVFGNELPRFDLILQGMGADGHTASLFPHTQALNERHRWVVPNYVQKMDSWRITMTYPVLNNAQKILFLVTGADKATALYEVLHGQSRPTEYPSQVVRPTNGDILWFLDQEAASKLPNRTS